MKTLVVIDVQPDFCPGGGLAVPEGDQVVPVINGMMGSFDLVVASQDWHPADHASFAANQPGHEIGEVIEVNGLQQILWPVHCVQETPGAALHPGLEQGQIARVFQKGTDAGIDSYSAFYDNGHRQSTGLADYLREAGATELWMAGLATDYCVKFSALDGVREGFDVKLVTDACRGVNLQPGDVDRAIEEMREAGVEIVTSTDVGRG